MKYRYTKHIYSKNYLYLQNLVNVMTQIKKFITEISQIKTLLKYIQAKSIEKNFKELCKEFGITIRHDPWPRIPHSGLRQSDRLGPIWFANSRDGHDHRAADFASEHARFLPRPAITLVKTTNLPEITPSSVIRWNRHRSIGG